jgi:hypothetical protein
MQGPQTDSALIDPASLAAPIADVLTEVSRRRIVRADRPLRCVSSSHLSGVCGCDSTIPTNVVTAAWAEELEQTGVREDRFFHFSWQGEVWRSYGLGNGRVRGVYCPTHCAEQHERSLARGNAPSLEPRRELAIAA